MSAGAWPAEATRVAPLARRVAAVRDRRLVHPAIIAGAGLCWALALTQTDATGVSGFGLLAALPPSYYLGLVLLTCGFAVAAASPRVSERLLAAYVLALAVVLHATTAILYPEPRYAWTYKHLGVIDYLSVHGHASRSIDIYQNWPGFFALNSWLSKTAGVSPLHYAGWAQLFFELLMVGAVVFALRGVTRDTRIQWTAAWFFLAANWLAQDYLAPQAFGFLLTTVVLGLVLRCSPWARPPRTRLGWALVGLVNRVWIAIRRGRPSRVVERGDRATGARAALVAGAVCSVAVIVSHQLSPVMLIVSVVALAVATRRPPLWVAAGMVGLELWWLWLGSDFVTRHFRLLDFKPGQSPRGGFGFAHALPGVTLSANISHLGIALVVAIAFLGLVRRLRSGYWDSAAATLIVAPPLIGLVNSYGGEGPLRVYLFALPWLAFFVAVACRPAAGATGLLRRSWRVLAVTAVVGTATLFGYFSQEPLNYMTHDDVAASRWFIDRAPTGATLTEVVPNIPDRSDANYARFLDDPRTLAESAAFRAHVGSPQLAVRDAVAFLRTDTGHGRYLLITPSQERYARYYGIATAAEFERLARALRSSDDFTTVYRHGDAAVLLFKGGRAPTATRGPTRAGA
jgi:hypothetical protein